MINKDPKFFWQAILFVLAVVALIALTSMKGQDRCDCFEDGWNEGYCYQIPNCNPIPAPPCPPATPQERDDCTGGRNLGFVMGRKEREDE